MRLPTFWLAERDAIGLWEPQKSLRCACLWHQSMHHVSSTTWLFGMCCAELSSASRARCDGVSSPDA